MLMNSTLNTNNSENKHYLTVNQVLQRSRMNDPTHVRRMNVSGSALEDISVMTQFPYVEVCSFAVNDISDLEPLRGCSRLQEVFLRKNRIADFAQILHLSHLPLRAIGLAENPISTHPDYRKFVISALPQLAKFDDVEVSMAERQDAEREFPDPFGTATEMGVASLPPMAGRPSNTASHGTMGSTSPPRNNNNNNNGNSNNALSSTGPASNGSSPYDAFANTFSGTSGMSKNVINIKQNNNNTNNKQQQGGMMSANKKLSYDNDKEEPMDHLAATSPSLGVHQMMMNKNNRYNGDEVPIGGVAMGGASRPKTSNGNNAPTATTASSSTRTSSAGPSGASPSATGGNLLAQKRAQAMRANTNNQVPPPTQQQQQQQQQSKNNFYDQEINVSVPASKKQQHHDQEMSHHHNTNVGGGGFSEDAAIQAVKVLLGSMSASGLAQMSRYINTIQK